MLEISRIRTHKDQIIDALKKRNIAAADRVDEVVAKDQQWRTAKTELEGIAATSNRLAKEIGQLFKEGREAAAQTAKEQSHQLKAREKALKEEVHRLATEIQQQLYALPNTPHNSVPEGNSAAQNEEIARGGQLPTLDQQALPHWELSHLYQLIDFEAGVKMTGSGFPVYTGKGARLQRALINFFLDRAEEASYTECAPPVLVNEASSYGTGQLPDKEGQMYYIPADDLYLISTAEIPLTNRYRKTLLQASDLPIKLAGYTPCFRREAGSYGKDVRGLNRLHQFDKVEIVRIERPDRSYAVLEEMVAHVRKLVEQLELPYRILRLCGGDLGFAAALTYDIEVYAAAQKRWLEVSSISNFETFQSNRLQLRFKDEQGKKHLAHTLNGSALALPRIVAALLENNQTADKILLPKALVPYTKFDHITQP